MYFPLPLISPHRFLCLDEDDDKSLVLKPYPTAAGGVSQYFQELLRQR